MNLLRPGTRLRQMSIRGGALAGATIPGSYPAWAGTWIVWGTTAITWGP